MDGWILRAKQLCTPFKKEGKGGYKAWGWNLHMKLGTNAQAIRWLCVCIDGYGESDRSSQGLAA